MCLVRSLNSAKLLIPLRIPELGPSLGRLITGTGRDISGFSLETHRYRLVTKVIEMGGEARRLATHDERVAALASLGRGGWLGAWEETVGPIADSLVERLSAHLEAEAAAVRMPARLRRRMNIDEVERRAIGARLGSAGAELIPALDEIERHSAGLMDAMATDRPALDAWQRSQLTAARRLEEAWMLLEDGVASELDAWRAVGDEISRWRKSLWPVYVVGTVGASVAVWAGLVWGGVFNTPAWLIGLWQALRSLSP